MPKKSAIRRCSMIVVSLLLLLTAYGSIASGHGANRARVPARELTGDERTSRATINGDLVHLKAFAKKLRELAGTTQLEEKGIGCDHCSNLNDTTPSLNFVFIREPQDRISIFVAAWSQVDRHDPDPTFSIMIENVEIGHICTTISTTCKNASYCEYITGGCDMNPSPPGCQACQ